MKPLNNIIEQKAYSLLDGRISELFGVRPTYSGVNISGQSALYVPAVLQAVRLISETIGSLPCKVYRETGAGKLPAKDHSAYRIVHKRANEWTGAGELRTLLTADALMYGDGYAKVVRFDDGRPFELHQLKRGKVTLLEDEFTGAPVYRVQEKTGTSDYPHTEILHIRSFLGTSPIALGKEAIGLAAILERHGAQFFGSGARPSVVIKAGKTADNDAGANNIKNVRNDFKRWKTEPSELLILPPEWDVDQPAMTSTDAQFLEHRLEQVREIARIFGVPPTMLFELTRGTWSNTEQMGAQFLQLCLRPWLDRWQDAYTAVLLNEDEQGDHYFEFVTDDLMRADAASRTANMTALVTNRIMTPNEVRAILNMPPLPGGDELTNPHTTSNAAPAPAPAKENA
ncbi:phage portal protein [Rhizobium sp. BK491]|uniref:phage portal protein n=1 Tax=Rhizobium sp. BK491 TaxID=2587009 RepID=UPI00161A76E2|nr:phage portal protein [Rhizobium sp. BK491]MBB3568746.1 HK97 family phage portal protein [Rhizobium sp. BK491]